MESVAGSGERNVPVEEAEDDEEGAVSFGPAAPSAGYRKRQSADPAPTLAR